MFTAGMAKAAAKKGRRAAIECSYEHWVDLYLRSETKDDFEAINVFELYADHCALCWRYCQCMKGGLRICRKCPLLGEICRESKCIDLWYNIRQEYVYRNRLRFHARAGDIRDALFELMTWK